MKVVIPLAIALVLGAAAVFVGREVMQSQRPGPAAGPQVQLRGAVVATDDLPAGSVLKEGDLRLRGFPEAAIPETAFREVSAAAGRVAAMPLVKGQMVLEGSLAPVGMGRGLQALIPEGMRAVTIQVAENTGLAGLLVPGCRVDVISTLQDERVGGTLARTVVEDVEVSAVGPRIVVPERQGEREGQLTRSVTLLVTPQQAEMLELAEYRGRPRLVLRGGSDRSPVTSVGVTYADLLGSHPAFQPVSIVEPEPEPKMIVPDPEPVVEAPAPPPPIRRTVQMIRAGKESSVTFQVTPEGVTTEEPADLFGASN